MTDTKIYARCTNPKVDYLTDGKLYEVSKEAPFMYDFFIVDDLHRQLPCQWEEDADATWERVKIDQGDLAGLEQQDPPQWALDKAAEIGGYPNYDDVACSFEKGAYFRDLVEAHAATLAKYETEPVDAVLLKAREIAVLFAEEINAGFCNDYRRGKCDDDPEMVALIAALKESSQ